MCDSNQTLRRTLCILGLWLSGALLSHAGLIFPYGSDWRYFIGTSEASSPDPAAWRFLGFNDVSWSAGFAPVGYGEVVTTTLPSSTAGNYSSVFFRKRFTITDLANISRLDLNVSVDDGAILWINGTEVARGNVPAGALAYNAFAITAGERIPVAAMITANLDTLLVEGENLVAVQIFNGNLTSSDLYFDAELIRFEPDPIPPVIVAVNPSPGNVSALTSVTVTFSEPVSGVNADDLLINGGGEFTALGVTGGPATYTFSLVQPPFGIVTFSWDEDSGIIDTASPPNAFDIMGDGASWEYNLVDDVPPTVIRIKPPPDLTVRSLTQIEVAFSENVVGVDASDLSVNGALATGLIVSPGNVYTFQFAQPNPGPVLIQWVNHGITDQAAVPNDFEGGSWNYNLDPNAPPPDLVVSEIMAANVSGLKDELGEAEDWIEIWNRGNVSVNLEGWSLTDDPAVPGKWVFPPYGLGANQYLVVFASARDIVAPTGNNRFHTNFKLGVLGDYIALYSPDTPPLPAAGIFGEFPEQRNDRSYGLDPQGNLRYFSTPTPGAPNGASDIIGVVEPVHFSVNRGYFDAPFQLHLSTPTPGAQIRYTTDGSEPTDTTGQLYGFPILIDKTTLLRAAAFRPDSLPSKTGTHTYFFNLSAPLRALPAVSIVTATNHLIGKTGIIGIQGGSGPPDNEWVSTVPGDPNQFHNPRFSLTNGPAWERPTSVEFIQSDNSGFQVDCGIRVHGSNWTRPRYTANDKFAFRLYFKSDYGPDRLDYPWFPNSVDNALDEVVLRAGHNDISNPFITDELIRRLNADMGQVASHGNFANLFVNGVPMTFRGQTANFYFNPVNRVKEGFLQAWHGGGTDWDIIAPFGDFQGGDRVSWNSMDSFLRTRDMSLQANYQDALTRLDMVNFIDYLLVNIYGSTWDWPHNNWRAARERSPNGIWRFYVWDAEGAFYIHGTRTSVNPPHNHNIFIGDGAGGDASDLQNTDEIATYYRQLRNSPEFRLLFADRIHKHFNNGGALTETNITARYNAMRTELTGVLNMATRIINEWVPGRRAALFTQFGSQNLLAPINPPSFNPFGGKVARGFPFAMSADSGDIYYTIDGSDPRVPFTGNISASALLFPAGGSIALDESSFIRARAKSGADWSALTEARFEVGILGVPLRITEIMYNPIGGNSAHEYIEVQNVGTSPLDVSGLIFEGITFTFPNPTILQPGQVYLIASDADLTAFIDRYPGALPNDLFAGNLGNGGERVLIRDVMGNIVVSVDYEDGGGWPVEADGGGYSLEIIDPLGPPDEPGNWRASLVTHGSPGQPNSDSPAGGVLLNEILADNLTAVPHESTFPDYVELLNTTEGDINIAGWSLSDSGDPRKYVFPANTIVPAGGYLVVWCDTNSTSGLHTGYALDPDGETVQLYNANTNRVDSLSFGQQVTDSSIGRIAGDWTLNSPTPNSANSAAFLAEAAQLSINEWIANPLPGEDDWIELYNKSSSVPVSLRGIYLQAGTSVHQLTSLAFLPPNGFIQLRADENPGPDHLDFRLPAAGATITLYDAAAQQIEQVSYTSQTEGASRGRYPDGSATLVNFIGTASPGFANYIVNYNGPVLNEVLARNESAVTNAQGRVADFIELFNGGPGSFVLDGMSLGFDTIQPGQWVFPVGTTLAAGAYLVLWCDPDLPPTTVSGPFLNTGRALQGESGAVYLFNALNQLVNSIEYGFQIEDRSIGRQGMATALLASPTPGAANAVVQSLGSQSGLRINEWMASPDGEDDWFELYNSVNLPVSLSGLYLTDNPSLSGATNHLIGPLSYIDAFGWVRWEASGQAGLGRNHVNFQLNGQGETLRLVASDKTNMIDTVYFGAQGDGVSQGRLPDGASAIVDFPTTPSPDRSNFLPVDMVINEALTHTDDPLEDAIELHNPTDADINIGGWFLSDNRRDFKKYRIADNTVVPAHGFAVFYAYQFNPGGPGSFALNSAHGGSIWLSQANAGGNLNGHRALAEFDASENGVSFGRLVTPFGEDFVAQTARSFGVDNPGSLAQFRTGAGLPNPGPLVGPVVISEILYHPQDGLAGGTPTDNTRDEFVELLNISTEPVTLHHSVFNANTWRLRGGVDFDFPSGITLQPGGRLVVVSFNPSIDFTALTGFQAAYPSMPPGTPIYGPYLGNLSNSEETVRLLKPDAPQGAGEPDAGFVPYILVDKVSYQDAIPWPNSAVDGGGMSLQKPDGADYGDNPLHWVADIPTPGAVNGAGIVPPPVITQSPANASSNPGQPVTFLVGVSGIGPYIYQWRKDGRPLSGANAASLVIPFVNVPDEGTYDVLVANIGGTALSGSARLTVTAPPTIIQGPSSLTVDEGANVTLSVAALGPSPLTYQWYRNNRLIAGATSASLEMLNVGLEENGLYEVRVTNPFDTVTASATLVVLVDPFIVIQPQDVMVLEGDDAILSIYARGTLPMSYRWRRGFSTLKTETLNSFSSFVVIPNVTPSLSTNNSGVFVNYTVIVTNAAFFQPGELSASAHIIIIPDRDHDGLSDAFETTYDLNPDVPGDDTVDTDLDDLTNREEFLAGTDPTDPESYLKVESLGLDTEGVVVRFRALAQKTYTVQYRDNLLGATWQTLEDVAGQPSDTDMEIVDLDSPGLDQRFYRLITPKQ